MILNLMKYLNTRETSIKNIHYIYYIFYYIFFINKLAVPM